MKSLKGHLLVAAPSLLAPEFAESVVLVVLHNDEGALGLILNRPTGAKIKDLWGQVSQTPCDREEPLQLGGPVQGSLMAIHDRETLSTIDVLPGVHVATELDKLEALVTGTDGPIRFFIGYSGWGAKQLESEIEQGAWLTAPATVDQIFTDDADLWDATLARLRADTIHSVLKIKDLPPDPSVN